MGQLNLVKLSVGTTSLEDLRDWQSQPHVCSRDGLPQHITRMWPKREAEILNGGSIYWVIKGVITCRQKIMRFDEVMGGDGIRRCAIVLEPELIRTAPAPKRAFQGWRYLKPEDTPADLPKARDAEEALPAELADALSDIGLI